MGPRYGSNADLQRLSNLATERAAEDGRVRAREDGRPAFDRSGTLWAVQNELNSIVTVTSAGQVREVAKNGSNGPLEFPSAIVFVGDRGYVSNYDNPRRDNLDANGLTARDGIGASIAQVAP
jgi:hypothetical protein